MGPKKNEFSRAAKGHLGDRFHKLGMRPYHLAPEFLSMADAVPIPQLETSFGEAQVPAELLDAMAMARPIIASSIGGLADILGNGRRGWLVPPGNQKALAESLRFVEEYPKKAEQRGKRARRWYEKNASTRAIGNKLGRVIHQALQQFE